jgi:3-phosphoshikimate 1-carboxyvinyltransferase
MSYPDTLEIKPLTRPPSAVVQVPGSKSITNRALVLGALSDPKKGTTLHGALRCEDTEVMVEALITLGFRVDTDWRNRTIRIRRGPHVSPIPAQEAELYLANSGTSMRFLTAMVSAGHGCYRLDGIARMRERPINDLLDALQQLGVDARSINANGFPPVQVDGRGSVFSDRPCKPISGKVQIRGEISSQFLSGLLMVAPLAKEPIVIRVAGKLVSPSYAAMTVRMMQVFGVDVLTDGRTYFEVPMHPWYQGRVYQVEPDASSASYFFAAAAIGQGEVTVTNLGSGSLQGDVSFLDRLYEMGCHTVRSEKDSQARGWPMHGIDVDMNNISDTVMTLAAVACFAEGPTTIRNVAHIRHKETDRLAALTNELRRVGAQVKEFDDGLTITPGPLHAAEIETYNDHRMAMSMALIGLRVPGIVIKNPACVAKTYPEFFEDLDKLRR